MMMITIIKKLWQKTTILATANTVFLRRMQTNKLPGPIQIHWIEKLKVLYK